MKKYIVRDGDTVETISQATGVRVNLLMAANPQIQDPTDIRPGQILAIPELTKRPGMVSAPGMGPVETKGAAQSGQTVVPKTTQGGGPAPVQTPHPQGGVYGPGSGAGPVPSYFGFVWPHVMDEDESWETLAKEYNVPVSQLMQLNPTYRGRPLQQGEIVYLPGHVMKPKSMGKVPAPGSASSAGKGAMQEAAGKGAVQEGYQANGKSGIGGPYPPGYVPGGVPPSYVPVPGMHVHQFGYYPPRGYPTQPYPALPYRGYPYAPTGYADPRYAPYAIEYAPYKAAYPPYYQPPYQGYQPYYHPQQAMTYGNGTEIRSEVWADEDSRYAWEPDWESVGQFSAEQFNQADGNRGEVSPSAGDGRRDDE